MYRTAIIGCGQIAGDYDKDIHAEKALTHAGAYRLCASTELVAVADPNEEKARAFAKRWSVPSWYGSYEEMLSKEKIDVVSLCLPTAFHYEAFKAVCRTPIKAIFCEKPLAQDYAHSLEMAEMARDRIVALNYFRRWNVTLDTLRRELRNGSMGRPINGVARYTKGFLGNGSHLIDLLRWFFGEPTTKTFLKKGKAALSHSDDPGLDCRLKFNGGFEVYLIHVPEVDYVFIDLDILTETGRIVVSQRGQKTAAFHTANDPDYPFRILTGLEEKRTEWDNCLPKAVEDIVTCLETPDRQPQCTMDDGLRAMEIANHILEQEKK